MKQLENILQGSPEWLAARKQYRTASEASIMMGCSPYATRNELVALHATGDEKEVSAFMQKIFDKGHDVEAKARPLAEEYLEEALYPITAVDDSGYLLASFDGITLLEDTVWECKQWNTEKANFVSQNFTVPECDRWQVVQQLVVSGAEYCLYTICDGESKFLVCPYNLQPGDKEKLIAGWKQFDADVAAYQPTESKPEPVGASPELLPALRIQVRGEVTDSNLAEFKKHALEVIAAVNDQLNTDQDFADAEKAVKWCADVESRIKSALDHTLSQADDIYLVINELNDVSDATRTKRLTLDRLIKNRKKDIREKMLFDAKEALREYTAHAQSSDVDLDKYSIKIPELSADFGKAVKGKKLFSTMQSAIDDLLASSKAEVDVMVNAAAKNLRMYDKLASDYQFLFSDLNALVMKPADDFAALVEMRIAKHKQAEEERERVRLEEAEKERETQERQRNTESGGVSYSSPVMASPGSEGKELFVPAASIRTNTKRPTDDEIIEVLAAHYRVNEFKVLDWLQGMNLNRISQRLVSNS